MMSAYWLECTGSLAWPRARARRVHSLAEGQVENRCGAPPWQPYFELRKLFAKEVVMAHNASWLFRVTPHRLWQHARGGLLIPFVFGRVH
jgi:formate hydrogenlyase subunit 4